MGCSSSTAPPNARNFQQLQYLPQCFLPSVCPATTAVNRSPMQPSQSSTKHAVVSQASQHSSLIRLLNLALLLSPGPHPAAAHTPTMKPEQIQVHNHCPQSIGGKLGVRNVVRPDSTRSCFLPHNQPHFKLPTRWYAHISPNETTMSSTQSSIG
jgi:hypothetical protein